MRHFHHKHHLHERHHASKRTSKIIYIAMWVVAVLSPFATIPQIIEVYRSHDVSGVSPVTWGLYVVTPCIWLSYGILHKDKFIIINNILWAILSSVVLLGIFLFR